MFNMMKKVHQIASFKITFSKKLQLLRGEHQTPPLHRASLMAGAIAPILISTKAPFFTSKIFPPPHFENRSAAYDHQYLWDLIKTVAAGQK